MRGRCDAVSPSDLRESAAAMHVLPRQTVDRRTAAQSHRPLYFGLQQRQRTIDAALAAGRQRIQVAATDTARRRPGSERLDDVVAAADAVIADDLEPIVQRVRDG